MFKIMCLLSNRASYYRQKVLLQKMEADPDIQLDLVVTSSLLEEPYADTYNEIHNNFTTIDCPLSGYKGCLSSMAIASARLTNRTAKIIRDNYYDCVLLLADRYELLPVAMAASYLNVPIAHVQSGEISGNIDDKVRNAVSMLSDIYFVSHLHAYNRLTSMGLDNVHNTGCPSIDMCKMIVSNETEPYIVGIFHPHTKELDKTEEQTRQYIEAVQTFARKKGCRVYFFASNNDPGYKDVMKAYKDTVVIINMVGESFLKLLASARMIVGNSSAGIREASHFGVPAVNIGARQKDRVCGPNVYHAIFNDIGLWMETAWCHRVESTDLFGDGNSSDRIIDKLKQYLGEKTNGKSKEAEAEGN